MHQGVWEAGKPSAGGVLRYPQSTRLAPECSQSLASLGMVGLQG